VAPRTRRCVPSLFVRVTPSALRQLRTVLRSSPHPRREAGAPGRPSLSRLRGVLTGTPPSGAGRRGARLGHALPRRRPTSRRTRGARRCGRRCSRPKPRPTPASAP
jgi:hypothetical protein